MVRAWFPWMVSLGALAVFSLVGVHADSERHEEGGVVTWSFVSPDMVPWDEGVQVTCLTFEDLRDDPIAVEDPVNEHVRFSCAVGQGMMCDYPSWTPPEHQDACSPALYASGCFGTLFHFTGTLRIEPVGPALFSVSYDGLYDDWEGLC